MAEARSSAGNIVEERREQVYTIPPPPAPAPAAAPTVVSAPPAPPPPAPAPLPPPTTVVHPPPVEEVHQTTIVRDASPARSHRSHSTSTTHRTPVVVEERTREVSDEVPVGPLALVHSDRRRDERSIRSEIARLEAERDLIRRERHHHDHYHRRSHSHVSERELVKAERLPSGELVLYEEDLLKVEEPRRGARIERDKKGKMSISVPKYRK